MRKTTRGFTIVELLIVIVVIAILATISIVAYNGIQQRARDTARKNDLAQLAKALSLHAADKGSYHSTGCGTGWFSTDPDGDGPNQSMDNCLIDGGYLQAPIRDPSGRVSCSGLGCYAYMISSCSTGLFPGTYLYAHLETRPQTATDTDATCSPGRDTQNGMNYYVRID